MKTVLRQVFLENVGLKVLALALATTLVVVKREDQTTVVTANVRVRVVHPEDRVLVSPPVDKVAVTIEGKYSALRDFDVDSLPALDINLSGYEEEQVTFEPEMFKVPPSLQVRVVRPAAMLVRFEPKTRKVVDVVAALEGEPQTGYRVTQVVVDPPTVTLTGAASVVGRIESVKTEPISLVGRNQTTGLSVSLAPPPAYAGYVERGRRHVVTVTIEEKRGTRVVAGRPVEVRNVPDAVYGFEVSPATVDITLHGPVRLLDALDASTLTAWVDATGVNPRRKQLHTRVVRFDPPEGLTASELKPDKVTLLQLDPPPDAAPPAPDGGDAGVLE